MAKTDRRNGSAQPSPRSRSRNGARRVSLKAVTRLPGRRARAKAGAKRAPKASAASTSDSPVTSVIVKQSPIHGRGVFAAKPFRKGEKIIEYTGRRILWSTVPEELDEQCTYYFGLDDNKRVIDPSVDGNEARFINHSCAPNCEAREDTRARVFIHALRKIKPGEELFYDYRLTIDDSLSRTKEIEEEAPCYCGAHHCRGTLFES